MNNTNETKNKMNEKTVWSFNVDDKIYVEIVHWGVDRGINNGRGCWNYYCFLPERILKEKFEAIWLKDKKTKFSKGSQEHITHNYMGCSFSDVDWHGGVTFYEKLGHTKGHRMVKIGCDFAHLWDAEREYDYSLEEVSSEARNTATELIKLYEL